MGKSELTKGTLSAMAIFLGTNGMIMMWDENLRWLGFGVIVLAFLCVFFREYFKTIKTK